MQRVSALAASRSSQGSLYNQQSPGPPELLIQLVCAGVGFIMFWKLLGDAAVLRGLRTPVRGCAVSWDMEGEHPGQAEAFEEAGTVASGGVPAAWHRSHCHTGIQAEPALSTCSVQPQLLPAAHVERIENWLPLGRLGQLQKSVGGSVPTWPGWSGSQSGCLVVEVVVIWQMNTSDATCGRNLWGVCLQVSHGESDITSLTFPQSV